MPDKPTTVPLLDTNKTNRAAPAGSVISDGYSLNDLFPASNANYLHGLAGDWIDWLDQTFGDGSASADLTLPSIGNLGLGDAEREAAHREHREGWSISRSGHGFYKRQ